MYWLLIAESSQQKNLNILGGYKIPSISIDELTDRLNGLGRHYHQSTLGDNSYAGEYAYLTKLISSLNLENGFVVDIAASDGVTQSCTLGFFQNPNWSGLAVEMDPIKFSKLAFVYADFSNTKLARCRVIPSNISSLLRGFEVPSDFTLLNLDIDSYDLYVIDEMLKSGFRPKIISMEINEKIPPPLFFTVDYDEAHYWQGDHFFGCSLTAAAEIVKPYGYILESLQYNNAMFIRSDIGKDVVVDLDVESAYNVGYRFKPDRTMHFPWNSNVNSLLDYSPEESIKFLNEFFKEYEGKYTLHA